MAAAAVFLRGRIVVSKFRRRAMESTQPSSPSGLPRWAQRRTVFNSASVSGSFTRAIQFGNRAMGRPLFFFGQFLLLTDTPDEIID